jgi:hypothetical protein
MITRATLRGDLCAYCLGQGGTVDHIRPLNAPRPHRATRGTDDPINRTGACARCNGLKGTTPMLLFLVRHGFPVTPKPEPYYRRCHLSWRRRLRIRAAFRRLDEIERCLKGQGEQHPQW